MPSESVIECSKMLAKMGLTIAFAESATAGWVCSDFALTPDSGKILKGGIVCYDACIKKDLLRVPQELIDKFTPESAEVTEAAALGLREIIPADVHFAITGLTSPGGSESDEKPVGTMFLHGLYGPAMFSQRIVFDGTKEEIINQTIDEIAYMLTKNLTYVFK